MIGAIVLPPQAVGAVQNAPCGDVQLVWAAGTGHLVPDDEFTIISGQLVGRLAGLAYSTYVLGLDGGFGGFAYPAEGGGIGFFNNWTIPEVGAYSDSVSQGKQELSAYLANRTVKCPNEVYILAGWSQGAQVIGEGIFTLGQSIQDRIAYVALFGDPTFSSGNLGFPFTDICLFDRQPWVRGTSPCWSNGVFSVPRVPYLPAGLETRTGSWCRGGDGSCTGIFNDMLLSTAPPDGQHFQYFRGHGDSAMAMREAAGSLKSFIPAHANQLDDSFTEFATGQGGADFVFVFDTTGSMSGSISNMKSQATALAHLWLTNSTNGRVALVEFKDQGDAFVSRIDLGLTSDETAFQNAVNGLSAGGGGDTPEAQLSGLMTALDGLSWQPGATKAALVITDASGKDPEPITGFTRTQVGQHALQIDPVALYGVDVIGDSSVTAFMQPLADATAGHVYVLGSGQTLSDLLASVITSVAMSPVAILGGPYFAVTGNPVHFNAKGSFDPDSTLVSYRWDFDANGTTDQTTSGPTVDHTYPGAYSGQAAVRVTSVDGGQALSTALVTVDAAGLADDLPIKPTSATATVTGSGQVTVSWTPAASDRADGYIATLSGTNLMRSSQAGSGNSLVFTSLDLSHPITFEVRAENQFGGSAPASTPQVGGAAPVTTSRVSESSTHGQGNGVSDKAFISSDGRYVTFRSSASTLVANDTNGADDVFVKDRQSNGIVAASSTAAGVIANARSDDGSISADGLHVAFRSQASNLVANDTNGTAWDTFVKDLATGAISRVSVSTAGVQANGASFYPVLSADGRWVAFRSDATNLITGDTNGVGDIYLRDRQTSTTTRISVATGGSQANGKSDRPTISNDGRYILYESDATNLVTGDTNAKTDVFRYDRTTGTTVRVSVSSSGVQGNGLSDDAAISGDGSTVAFESASTNLVSSDTNAKVDVFVRTIATGITVRASVGTGGAQANNDSSDPSLSTNGTKVGFASNATNLISSDTNSRSDIFVRDLFAGTNSRFSVATDGTAGNNTSQDPWLSADAGTVAFQSVASNLVPNDTNNTSDIFVRGPAMGPG